MNNEILKCQNLTKYFGEGDSKITILKDLSLNIHKNQTVAIMGVSGSGKSTLLHILGGLDSPNSGEVYINGQSVSGAKPALVNKWRQEYFGFIFQFHFLIAELSALENTALPLLIRGENKKTAHEKAKALLEKVGLENRLIHRPSELSGGERQRVAVARALVGNPSCIFADEPTGSLDRENALRMWTILKDLCQSSGTSLILVTHDSRLAKECDIKYQLQGGCLKNL